MLTDDFQFIGGDERKKQFVETVNMLAKLINGIEFDFGENGGTNVAKVTQTPKGLKIDLTALYIPPDPNIP